MPASDRRDHRRGRLYGRTRPDRGPAGGRGIRPQPGLRLGAPGGRACTIWRDICSRRCSRPTPPVSRSWRCWCPAATPSWSTSRGSAATASSASRWTMPPARRSTRPPSCWACRIPAAPRWRGWPRRGRPGRSVFPRPMLDRRGSDFSFSGLKTAALVALRGRVAGRRRRAPTWRAAFEDAVVDTLAEKTPAGAAATGTARLVRGRRRGRQSAAARAAARRWPRASGAAAVLSAGRNSAPTTAR